MFKRVLISTDGSQASNKAAKAGIAFAKVLGAKVSPYYAVESMQPFYSEKYVLDQKMIEQIEKRACQEGQKYVDPIGKLVKSAGVPFASVVSKANTPYEGIIDTANKRRCDVIFMASHGRRDLSKLVMAASRRKFCSHSKILVAVYR